QLVDVIDQGDPLADPLASQCLAALAGIGDHGHHRAVARLVRVHGDTGAQSEADHADPEVVRILHGVSPSWSGAGPESVPMRWTTRSRGGTTSRAAEEARTDSREQVSCPVRPLRHGFHGAAEYDGPGSGRRR